MVSHVSGPHAREQLFIELLCLVQVEQLSREIRSSGNVTIIRDESKVSQYPQQALLYSLGTLGVVVTLYLTVGRRWRLSDLYYVTRRAFREGMTSLATGIESVNARLADLKARVQARLIEISRKQDEAAIAQATMSARLVDIGNDVDTVRSQMKEVHSAVMEMDTALGELGDNQRHALLGIYVLVKAVSELASGSNINSKQELMEFTQSPMWQRLRPQGLEGILATREGDPVPKRQPYLFSLQRAEQRSARVQNEDVKPLKTLPRARRLSTPSLERELPLPSVESSSEAQYSIADSVANTRLHGKMNDDETRSRHMYTSPWSLSD